MIDIIITTYNSKNTLEETLNSIIIQKNIPQINIYIIDDCSTEDYSDILSKFEHKLKINFYKLPENKGPGNARNVGLSLSKEDYIIFIDSDDVFYDEYSINKLYSEIKNKKCDVVTSCIYEEVNGKYKEYKNELIGLHGKIYNRNFIQENNIKFSDTRRNEDYVFNSLIKLFNGKISNIDDITYIWKENESSLTRKDKTIQYNIDCKSFVENSLYVIKYCLINNCDIENIIPFCAESIVSMYYKFQYITDNSIKKDSVELIRKICQIYKLLNPTNKLYDYIKENNLVSKKREVDLLDFLENLIFHTEKISNYQRMQKGLLYYPLDDEFGEIKKRNLKLMDEFNKCSKFDYNNKNKILLQKKMFGYIDNSSIIEPPVQATWGCKNVYVGKNCYLNFNITFVDDGKIIIGNNVFIAPNVSILTNNHLISPNLRNKNLLYAKDVIIKDNVWIGAGVTILPGVTIGENSVIGAGSIVTKDIPNNVIAVGNPCKVIREINFYDDIFYDSDKIVDYL